MQIHKRPYKTRNGCQGVVGGEVDRYKIAVVTLNSYIRYIKSQRLISTVEGSSFNGREVGGSNPRKSLKVVVLSS